METARKGAEVVVMVKRWLLSGVVMALVLTGGMVSASVDDGDTPQEFSRRSSLEALKRGYLATENGDHEEAYGHYKTALETAADSELRYQAYFALGSAASALGQFDEAREHLNRALEIKPDSATVVYSLGLVA